MLKYVIVSDNLQMPTRCPTNSAKCPTRREKYSQKLESDSIYSKFIDPIWRNSNSNKYSDKENNLIRKHQSF